MECTSCPRMLHSQPTGSTETGTRNMRIQSPMHYPLGHHVSIRHDTYTYTSSDTFISILGMTPVLTMML